MDIGVVQDSEGSDFRFGGDVARLTDFIEEDGVLPVHDDLSEKGGSEAEGREDKNDGFLHEIRV